MECIYQVMQNCLLDHPCVIISITPVRDGDVGLTGARDADRLQEIDNAQSHHDVQDPSWLYVGLPPEEMSLQVSSSILTPAGH